MRQCLVRRRLWQCMIPSEQAGQMDLGAFAQQLQNLSTHKPDGEPKCGRHVACNDWSAQPQLSFQYRFEETGGPMCETFQNQGDKALQGVEVQRA